MCITSMTTSRSMVAVSPAMAMMWIHVDVTVRLSSRPRDTWTLGKNKAPNKPMMVPMTSVLMNPRSVLEQASLLCGDFVSAGGREKRSWSSIKLAPKYRGPECFRWFWLWFFPTLQLRCKARTLILAFAPPTRMSGSGKVFEPQTCMHMAGVPWYMTTHDD